MGIKLKRPSWIGQDATTAEAKRKQLLEERPGIARAAGLFPGILKRIAKEPELLKQGPDAVVKATKERLQRAYIKRYGQPEGLKPIINLQPVPVKELERWEVYVAKTKDYKCVIYFDLLHSDAFRVIKDAPTLKVLFWSMEKVKKQKVGVDWVSENKPFPFTYDEAVARGLTIRAFKRATRVLVFLGFWDIEHTGRGLQQDYSIYRLSERWREYGQPGFKEVTFPEKETFGFHGKQRKK